MAPVDPDLYAKLMAMSDHDRSDLLAFLGAEPRSDAETANILDALVASITLKQVSSGTKPT